MVMDGVTIPVQTGEESTREVFKGLPPAQKESGGNGSDSGVDLAKAVSSVSITEFSRRLDRLHEELEQIEDPEARRLAVEGLKETARELARISDPETGERYRKAVGELSGMDHGALRETFETVGALKKEGQDIANWLVRLLKIDDPALQHEFVKESRAILLN